ncbi:hypothetical protein AB1Y20_002573 [Prymnesium parvum]|uniref:Serine hydrolase domain-containing protein n=1 Tax=Prymnesium parvum TaxID=97485 RepID=A0AB34JB11_PRYPA
MLAVLAGTPGLPAIGAASSRRFLLLHGSGTSAGAFLNSPTASGAKSFLSGVPCRVDAGGDVPPNWLYSAVDAGTDDGSWWKGDALEGIDRSIAKVEAAVDEQQAVGIIGHEQGATLAAIIAARSALGDGPPLKFAVLCGGAMPSAAPYAELLHRLRDTAEASIPTLHCIGGADGSAEALAACFGPTAEILRHDQGSAMPGPRWWEDTQGFPEKVIGGNRWVTQFRGPFWY